jgi:hypothetical protein
MIVKVAVYLLAVLLAVHSDQLEKNDSKSNDCMCTDKFGLFKLSCRPQLGLNFNAPFTGKLKAFLSLRHGSIINFSKY